METGESVSLLMNESSTTTSTTSLTKCPMPPVSPQSSDPDPSLTIDDGEDEEDEDELEQQPEQQQQPIQQLKNNLKGDDGGGGSLNSNGHHHYSDGYDSMAQPADCALTEDIDSNIDNNGGGGGSEFDLAQSETQKFVSNNNNNNCLPSASSSSLAEEPNNKINEDEDAGQPLSLSIKDGPSGSNVDSASDNGESDNGPGTDDNSKNESASSQPLNLMHSSPVSSAASDSSTGNIFSSTPTALSSTGSSSATTTSTPSSNIRHFKKALIYSSTNQQQQQSNNDSIITGAASTNPLATSQFSPPLPMLPPATTVSPSSLFKIPSGVATSSSSSSNNWNLKSSSSSKPNEAILQSLQASLLGPTSSSSSSTPSTLAVSPIPAEKKKLADFSIASITSSSMQTHSTPTQLPKHLSPSSSSPSSSTSQEPPALSPIIPLHQLIQEQGRKVAEMFSKSNNSSSNNNNNNNNMAGTSSGDSNPTGLELEQLTQAAAMIDAIKSLNEYHQITQKQFQQQQQHQQQQQVLASNPMISEFLKQQQNALLAVTAAAAASGQGTSSGGGNSRYHHHDSSVAGGSGSGNRNESAHLSKISHTDTEDNQLAQQAGPSHQEQLQAHAAQDLLNLYQQHSKSSMKYFQMGSSGGGGSSSSGRPGNKSGSLGGSGQVRGRPAGSGTKRKRLKSSDSASLELEQLQQQYQLIHHQDEDDDEDDLIQHKQLLAAAQSQQFSPNFFLNTTGNSSRASTSGGRSFGGDHHQISTDQVSSGGSFASPMPPMVTHVGRKPLNGPPCSLKTLVDDLILDPLDRSLTYEILGSKFVGDLLSNGFIRMSGTTQIFANPSSWANYCRSTIPSCSKDQKHYGSAWSIIRYLGKRLDSYKLRWYRKQRKQYVANVSASFGSPYGMSSMSHASTSSGPSSSNNSFASNLAGMLPQQQQQHSQKGGNSTIGSGGSSSNSSKLQNQNLESLLANFASSGMLKYPGTSGAGGSGSSSSTAGTSTDASNSKANYASLLGSFNAAAAAAAAANNSAVMANLQNSTVASMQSSSSSISSQLPRNSIEMKSLVSFLNRDRLWKLDKISAGDSEFNSEFAHIVDENISLNDTNESAIPVSSGSNGGAAEGSVDPDGAAIVPEKKVPAAPSATVSSNDASLSFNSIDLNSKQTNLDSNSKISCVPFSAIYCLQPFMVTISTNVLLLIDFHSHLISSEVSGYLAGIWDPRQQMLTISQAYPFRCKNVKDQQSQVLEIKQSIYQRGLQLVGWYHSHPNSVPHPTVADIRKQLSYQKKMLMAAGGGGSTSTKPTGNGMNGNSSKLSSASSNQQQQQQQQQQAMYDYSPCVGLIVSPFYQRNHTKKLATLSQMFWVMPLFANNNRDMGRPMQLSYNITRDAFLTQDLLVEMRMLATYFSAHDNFIKFSDHYRIDTSFWDKLQESLKSKLPKDLVEVHSQTVQNEIQQQALMHFWSFLKNLLLIA